MSKQTSGSDTFLRWSRAILVAAIIGGIGFFVYSNAHKDAKHPFKLGLDLSGGSHLVYEADVTKIDPKEVPKLMGVLRELIERRVNAFGVSEPIVQVESSSFVSDTKSSRLVVELPGVTDIAAAIDQIGKTPTLEFKLLDKKKAAELEALKSLKSSFSTGSSSSGAVVSNVSLNGQKADDNATPYVDTGLTGRYLETATLEFSNGQAGKVANDPMVSVKFNEEGAKLFTDITTAHTGEQLGIFLDGQLLSSPVINEPITGGKAVISGKFTIDEAQSLAKNLSFGALPVPISLASTQTIDATLGSGVVHQSLLAGIFGFLFIAVLMIGWYRVPGLVACVALISYVLISLLVFLLVPVTLTAAGLAGLVLSIGIAVDANVLVFERFKEEFRSGKGSREAIEIGFSRAWSAIRDSHVTGLISAVILFWFGTAMIKGFALVFAFGIIISLISAISITRTMLLILPDVKREDEGVWPYLFGTGLTKK
jgi:preprotein translocase subunit SecD